MKYFIVLVNSLFIVYLSGCGGASENPSIDVPIAQLPPTEDVDEVEVITVDIETAIYSGDILHNSSEYHSDLSNQEFLIKGAGNKGEFTSLTSLEQSGFERQLILGSYQVEYSEQNGVDMPLNESMVIRSDISLAENLMEDINIESYSVSFNALLNGLPFPSSPATEVLFFLNPVEGGAEIFLGSSFIAEQSVRILAGKYQVVYKYIRGENIPINVDFTLPEIYSIVEDTIIEIEVDSVDARVLFNSENNKFQFDSENVAHFLLKSASTESPIDLGSTEQQIIGVQLIAGDYDLIYDYRFGDQIPINTKQKIAEISVVDGTVIQPIVDSISLDGDFFHNGAIPSDSGLDHAWLFLQEQDSQERYMIGRTHELRYENLNILAGTYDVIYEYREGDSLPTNSYTPMIESVPLLESGRYDINIKSILVDFNVTLNGEAFPESGLSYANIYLDRKGDEQVFLGETNLDLQQVRILAGDYTLHYYAREFESVPINQHFVAEATITLPESGQYSHNFEAKLIRVEALINGREDLSGALAYGNLYLELESNSRIQLGTTYRAEDVMVMNGSYELYYEFWEGWDIMPQNKYSKVQSIEIQ